MTINIRKRLALLLALMPILSGCGASQEDVGGTVVPDQTVLDPIPGSDPEAHHPGKLCGR